MFSMEIIHFYQKSISIANSMLWHEFMPFFFFLIYFLLVFNLLTYRITPSALHPITPTPYPPPLLLSFPRVSSLYVLSPFLIFPTHFFSLPLYSPNEWEHIMFVLHLLTYFTQHNTLQFHPRWSKWWVFVISNSWGIFHCIHKPHLLYPFIFRWTPRLLPQFGYCGHCCYKHRGAGVPAFHCIWIFGVNPQQCNYWVVGQIYF